MFACGKWHFPLLLWGYLVFAVRIFGVVLTGKLFRRLTSWTLRWFLKLLGKPKNVWNHSGIFKSNHQPCCQEANPNGCPKSAFQSPVTSHHLLLPFWIWLVLTHCTGFHWHFIACPLSPRLDFVCCLPAATHTIRHSKDKRVLSTQQLTKKRDNLPMCLFAEEHSINSINGDKEDLIIIYNNSLVVLNPH